MNIKNKNVLQLPLVEGHDFAHIKDYEEIFKRIEENIGSLSVSTEALVIAGYDANEVSDNVTDRKETFAVTLDEFRQSIKGIGPNPILYSGLGRRWSKKPVIGVYDASNLHRDDQRYFTPHDTPIDQHKIIEFPLHQSENGNSTLEQ